MTTPQAPGAPEGGQHDGDQPAPGAQDTPQNDTNPTTEPKPAPPQPLGKPQASGTPKPEPSSKPEPAKTDDPQDVTALPDWAQKQIKELRAEAGKARTTAKQNAAEEARQQLLKELGKTLGLESENEPTLESLAEQLKERDTRIEELEAAQAEHSYERIVRSAATTAKADADALLDSNGFLDDVKKELDDEFTDEELTAAVSKVAKEYAKKPRFAVQQAPARSGGEITGGPPPATKQRPRSLTEAISRDYGLGR